MCGIAGFAGCDVDFNAPAVIRRMCDAIRHRGPDEDGYFIDNRISLGVRRLSIIGVRTGAQPVWNEDRSVCVVFNGEIYNFQQLRERLQRGGHTFSTSSDTECIVHLYEDLGDRCVDHLRGMFAFAIWDDRRGRLLLARDRVGVKPLYYAFKNGTLLFASELKALVAHPLVDREVDLEALNHYLTLQYVPDPWSIYAGVKKLPPAHLLVFEDDTPVVSTYWTLPREPKMNIDFGQAVERTRALIREATSVRLVSERPLGAFLSGGIDSSVVVAAMAEASTRPVKTYTIGFKEPAFDERKYARAVATRLGTEHHELEVDTDVSDVLSDLAWCYDEPFADSSAVPTWHVSRLASDHVTVVLNGDGGDESFGGYDRYRLMLGAAHITLPPGASQVLRTLVRHSPLHVNPRLSRVGRALDALSRSHSGRYGALMAYIAPEEKLELCRGPLLQCARSFNTYDLLMPASDEATHLLDRLLSSDTSTYLPGDLLVKVDRSSMAHSLEARSPFLDHKLMEFAALMPSSFKATPRRSKILLKAVAQQWLPEEIINRRKRGFGVPLAKWLRFDLRDMAYDLLTDHTASSRGYFDMLYVRKLLDEHMAGLNRAPQLWALLMLELWHRRWT